MKMVSAIFPFGCTTYKRPKCEGLSSTNPPKMTTNSFENIRESILDFTTYFGEISPDKPYLVDEDQSGPLKGCFCLFPLYLESGDEKTLNI